MFVLILIGLLMPHKYHTSLTQLRHNHETKSLEVEMRVFSEDLEQMVAQKAKQRISLEQERAKTIVADYVKQHFVLRKGDQQLDLKWVGMEIGVRETWLMLEAPFEGDLQGWKLMNGMLFEIGHQQVNTVNISDGDRKTTLTFKERDADKTIVWL